MTTIHTSYILQHNDEMDPEYMGRLVRSTGNADDPKSNSSPLSTPSQQD